MSFAEDDLDRIADVEEIDIETGAPDKPARRTTIWVVVAEGEVYVRSVRGERGSWYGAAIANPAVGIRLDGRRLSATAIPASDPASIDRVSAAFQSKYARQGASLASMLQPDTLPTTLRHEPV